MRWVHSFANISPRALRVWQRDADVFRKTIKVNFLPPLLEPVLYVAAFGFGLGSLVGTVSYLGQEVRYLTFMVPGVISVAVMFWAYFETTYSSFVRMYYQRTFDAILATPLLVEDVIAGEWLWGATKSVAAGTLMLLMVGILDAGGWAGDLLVWPDALLVIPLSALGGLLFAALGLITTSIVPQIDSFNIATFIFIFPMFLFSGTFFPIDILPGWASTFAWVLPLTHVSYLIRGAFLGQAPPHWYASLGYLLVLMLTAAGAAIVLMRRRLVK